MELSEMSKPACIKTPRWNALAVLTAAATVVSAGCGSDNPPFDPRAIQRNEREAARRDARPHPMRPLPTTLESQYVRPREGEARPRPSATAPTTGPALSSDRIVRMPLQEVVHRAVANNLDVRVAGYGPAIESTRVVEAEARFDPTVFANLQFERRNNRQPFNTVTSVTDNIDKANIITGSGGIRQFLESGGQVELRYQSSWNDIRGLDDSFGQSPVDPNPYYDNQAVLQLQQPLLQNFGNDINRARITIGRNNERISLLDFRRQVEETTRDVERTYWQLVQAERDERIALRLLNETLKTADILLKRLDQDVTRVQVSQANASVESRRAALIRQRARVRDLSDQLKRLMQDPDMPVTSGDLLLPAETGLEEPVHFDLGDEIATAMENRFELGQQQLRIDSANVAADVARNNELPQLNLVGQVGLQGLDDQFTGAISDHMDTDRFNYQIGLQFEYPLGNRAAKSVSRRARLQQLQAIEQYRNLTDQIALDVKTALREVQTSWDEIAATRQARFAAADSLSAIEQREAGGEALTPTFVQLKLQQQEQLSDAARQESQAVANYNTAIVNLEFAKGTLLRYNNVMLEEENSQLAKR
jgi:outer membrane protein TolC